MSDESARETEFEKAAKAASTGLLAEFWLFLRDNKKWWLLPILVVMFALGGLLLLGGTAAAPFIYTLF